MATTAYPPKRDISAEQKSLEDLLKQPSAAAAFKGGDVTTALSKDPALAQLTQESVNLGAYGTATPIFRPPTATEDTPEAPETPAAAAEGTVKPPGAEEAAPAAPKAETGAYTPPALPPKPDTSAQDEEIRQAQAGFETPQEIDQRLAEELSGIETKYVSRRADLEEELTNRTAADFAALAGIGNGVNPLSSAGRSIQSAADARRDRAIRADEALKAAEVAVARATARGEKNDAATRRITFLTEERDRIVREADKEFERTRQHYLDTVDGLNKAATAAREDRQLALSERTANMGHIKSLFDLAGSKAFDGASDEAIRNVEKAAGLQYGTIKAAKDRLAAEEKALEEQKKRERYMTLSPGQVVFDPETGKPIYSAPKAAGGDGESAGGVFFGGAGGTGPEEGAGQTFEEFLAAAEEKAGQTFTQARRDALKRQFEAQQAAATTTVDPQARKKQWLSSPDVDARVKDIVAGRSKFTDYTQTERKAMGTQYQQAVNDGVVPMATTAVQDAKLQKVIEEFEGNAIIKNADKAAGLNKVADQIIANPKGSANQLKALYGLVKGLDPDSAVREGELTLAESTLSTLDRIGLRIQKLTGGRAALPADLAVEYANAVKELNAAWKVSQRRVYQRAASRAKAGTDVSTQWSEYIAGFEDQYPGEDSEAAPGEYLSKSGKKYNLPN